MSNFDLELFCTQHPDWYVEDDCLVAGFEFVDFTGVTKVLPELLTVITECDHHPVVTFDYNTIEIRTTTHDAGNTITDRDFDLAEKLSTVFAS